MEPQEPPAQTARADQRLALDGDTARTDVGHVLDGIERYRRRSKASPAELLEALDLENGPLHHLFRSPLAAHIAYCHIRSLENLP